MIVPDELLGGGARPRRAVPRTPPGARGGAGRARWPGSSRPGRCCPGTTEGLGSNSWVVAGEHTATGAPLLANDPHLAPASPSTWHQVGLHCREVDDALPVRRVRLLVLRHARGVRRPQRRRRLGPDHAVRRPHRLRAGEGGRGGVRARRADAAAARSARRSSRSRAATRSPSRCARPRTGPLLSDVLEPLAALGRAVPVPAGAPSRGAGYAVSLRWTATEPGRTMDARLRHRRAPPPRRTWSPGRRLLDVPGQNIVFAEQGEGGSIGYVVPSRVPVRGARRRHPAGPGLGHRLRLDRLRARGAAAAGRRPRARAGWPRPTTG